MALIGNLRQGFKKKTSYLKHYNPVLKHYYTLNSLCNPLGNHEPHKTNVVLLFFREWKTKFITDFLPEYNVWHLPYYLHHTNILKWLVSQDLPLIIWGYKERPVYTDLLGHAKLIYRMEDGFLRSRNLGAFYTTPLSIVLDKTGLYYDATRPSDLENILNHHEFNDKDLIEADRLMALMRSYGLSKYNHAPKIKLEALIGPKTKRRVLVIGQVERDASIKYGGDKIINNHQLIELALRENPDAEIVYKIHPDVLAQRVKNSSLAKKLRSKCTVLSNDIAPCSLFDGVDHVYTITSLMGFEALLHDRPVTCVGAPFYSNWGLTDDRFIIPRRQNRLSLAALFYAAYVLYPRSIGGIDNIINRLAV